MTAHPGFPQPLYFVDGKDVSTLQIGPCTLHRCFQTDLTQWNNTGSTTVSSSTDSRQTGKQSQCAHFSVQVDNALYGQSISSCSPFPPKPSHPVGRCIDITRLILNSGPDVFYNPFFTPSITSSYLRTEGNKQTFC